EALLVNYYRTSAMRYYFGQWTARQMGTAPQMLPGQLATPPTWYRVIRGTTRAIVAPSGRALLFDSAAPAVAEHVAGLIAGGAITGVDAVWISHYHDDHVGGIAALIAQTGCAVWAHRGLVDILEHPDAYCMPGLDSTVIHVDRILEEGERFTWEGFTLSAYDFPGQTIYHSALFIEYAGTTLLIAGDSFTPGGLDDYCAHNRNLLGAGRGYERCLDVLEQLQPDLLVNMHVVPPFVLPATFLAEARTALHERQRLLERLLPWEHPNFGLDPGWARAYPYRQTLAAESRGEITLQFSNYADSALHVGSVWTVPAGWTVRQPAAGQIAPATDGTLVAGFVVPPDTPAGRYILTADVSVNGRTLGAWVEALVDIGDI
ncbi:MAG TPA: MBL fold metallo-hydrolase, partial [Chloroflexota bacterium]|nr:MBL fold metallo-hydrolase [Chloroflexota bacterium]